MIRDYHVSLVFAKTRDGVVVEPKDPPTAAEMDAVLATLMAGEQYEAIKRHDGQWILISIGARPVADEAIRLIPLRDEP